MSFRAMVIIFLLKEAKYQMLLGITFLLKAFRCAPNIPVIVSDFALGLESCSFSYPRVCGSRSSSSLVTQVLVLLKSL